MDKRSPRLLKCELSVSLSPRSSSSVDVAMDIPGALSFVADSERLAMVSVVTNDGAHSLFIVGHGITVHSSFELASGIFVEPTVPGFEMQDAADGSARFTDYSAVITGLDAADFSLKIESEQSGEALAVKGWNALWNFHLLSLAAQSPVCSLFSMSPGIRPIFAAANRNVLIRRFADAKTIGVERLAWARDNKKAFDVLVKDPAFNAAMRCYGNSHYLFDADMRIMLLWSGIEGLLSVDSELTRRIALYAALMIEGSQEDKLKWFAEVKKAYGVRSKAVHGGNADEQIFQDGYQQASRILVKLLARCVEIGRVPTPAELDTLAVSSTLN